MVWNCGSLLAFTFGTCMYVSTLGSFLQMRGIKGKEICLEKEIESLHECIWPGKLWRKQGDKYWENPCCH